MLSSMCAAWLDFVLICVVCGLARLDFVFNWAFFGFCLHYVLIWSLWALIDWVLYYLEAAASAVELQNSRNLI